MAGAEWVGLTQLLVRDALGNVRVVVNLEPGDTWAVERVHLHRKIGAQGVIEIEVGEPREVSKEEEARLLEQMAAAERENAQKGAA